MIPRNIAQTEGLQRGDVVVIMSDFLDVKAGEVSVVTGLFMSPDRKSQAVTLFGDEANLYPLEYVRGLFRPELGGNHRCFEDGSGMIHKALLDRFVGISPTMVRTLAAALIAGKDLRYPPPAAPAEVKE